MSDYEYKGLMAEAWDLLRGDTSQWEDRFFYLDVLKRYGQPALDVGCGTGRLLLDYLALGMDVDGVDNSPEMLALCRQKAAALHLTPQLYEQYVEELDLPRTYRTILVPSSSLQLIIDPALVVQAVQQLHAHLEPGGALAASFMTLWQEGAPLESEWEKSVTRPADGAIVRRLSRSRYDPASECEDSEELYEITLDGQVIAAEKYQRSPAVRSYTQAQARALFAQAGFSDIQLYHEFEGTPVVPEDTLFSVVAVKTTG